MDNFNGYQTPVYQQNMQPNMYYQSTQPTVSMPYNTRNWQQFYQVPTQPAYQQNVQSVNSNLIWVQGISGAKAYNIPNGTTLPLWDSEAQVIYIKSVDANGKPSMTILDYTERDENAETPTNVPEYATKEQIDKLNEQFSSINKKFEALGSYVTKDQFNDLNNNITNLSDQIQDIENRIMSFGKPQQNSNQNYRKGNNK